MNSELEFELYPGLRKEPLVEVVLKGEESTRKFGAWLGSLLERGGFLGLIGDLGAGKTTLMQGLVAARSAFQVEASSPTYALVQEYDTDPKIFHMDLYRLESFEDLESIGYWDYLDATEGIVCVEWLDRIPEAWPERGWVLELQRDGMGRRIRLFSDAGKSEEELNAIVRSWDER